MKTLAKDLKVGQTVKYINVWVKIEDLKQATAKNGRPYMAIKGTQLAGFVKHRGCRPSRVVEIKDFTVEFWNETTVTIK